MYRRAAILAITVLAGAGCAGGSHGSGQASRPASSSRSARAAGAIANGKSIFLSGTDLQGHRITATPPALYPSCADCHRPNGAGGMHLPGGAVSADLRHNALVTRQHPPYTVGLLERAISTGVDNTGQPLDKVMPRWNISKRDLHDVALYVYTQLK